MFSLPATIVKAAEHATEAAAHGAHGAEELTGMAAKFEELNHVLGHLTPHVKFHIGPIPVTSTIVNTWIVMVVLTAIVFFITRKVEYKPRSAGQKILEMYIEFIGGLLETVMGKKGRKFIPFVGTVFLFILALNLSWFIPGMIPPTTDFNTTFGLSIATILAVNFIGIREKGLKHYLQHYLEPNPIMAPLTFMEQFTHAFSLGIRLFGNMFGEKMVVTVLTILAPLIFPLPVQLLGIIMGIIQAFVFTLLTITYISEFVLGH
ncbi:MAG: F0F1 ATP synthase subunit A [Firmicutes bacterium]|nr:F0F1 ATP synthase subunit A [Bacillota bacterium]